MRESSAYMNVKTVILHVLWLKNVNLGCSTKDAKMATQLIQFSTMKIDYGSTIYDNVLKTMATRKNG
jgi:hypothetical protein